VGGADQLRTIDRYRIASVAPHTRPAFSTIASRTGRMSVGEAEIARRISLVAVCCSKDSVRSRLRASSS
jgi:hypothetical protein